MHHLSLKAAPRSRLGLLFLLCSLPLAASGCSLLLDFSESDSDSPDGSSGPGTFFPDKCADANGSLAVPRETNFPAGQVIDSSICNGASDNDFYQLTATGTEKITLDLTYTGTGNLGIKVHDPDGSTPVVKEEQGKDGVLQVALGQLLAGEFVIEIYVVDSGEANYELKVTFESS